MWLVLFRDGWRIGRHGNCSAAKHRTSNSRTSKAERSFGGPSMFLLAFRVSGEGPDRMDAAVNGCNLPKGFIRHERLFSASNSSADLLMLVLVCPRNPGAHSHPRGIFPRSGSGKHVVERLNRDRWKGMVRHPSGCIRRCCPFYFLTLLRQFFSLVDSPPALWKERCAASR